MNTIIQNSGQVTHDVSEITKATEGHARIVNNIVISAKKVNKMTKVIQRNALEIVALAEESSGIVEDRKCD